MKITIYTICPNNFFFSNQLFALLNLSYISGCWWRNIVQLYYSWGKKNYKHYMITTCLVMGVKKIWNIPYEVNYWWKCKVGKCILCKSWNILYFSHFTFQISFGKWELIIWPNSVYKSKRSLKRNHNKTWTTRPTIFSNYSIPYIPKV